MITMTYVQKWKDGYRVLRGEGSFSSDFEDEGRG
jgi:hypothetical protein